MSAALRLAAAAAAGLYVYSAVHGGAGGTGHSHSAAVRYAEAQIGKPYRWGAAGPGSFDCSGLAMRAEQAAGIWLPRTSQEQWREGRRVSRPKPGDLAFFAGGDGSMTAPGHVGIIVDPRRRLMVDAPQPGADVREESYAGWPDLVGFTDPGSR